MIAVAAMLAKARWQQRAQILSRSCLPQAPTLRWRLRDAERGSRGAVGVVQFRHRDEGPAVAGKTTSCW